MVMEKVANLGTPVPVEVAAVEQELRALWKAASADAGESAVIRARSCNLVVLAHDLRESESILPVLARISEWHPSRALIACRESDAPDNGHPLAPHMHAWISAQCSLPSVTGPQVCSEVITLAARSSATADLLNAVTALLVPDLPVFIYWRSFKEEDRSPVEQLARSAQLLIVDSHTTKGDAAGRQRLMEFLLRPPRGIAVRDLNWARLNAWRDLVAQFFDDPALRREAHGISEVEIERDIAAPSNVPTRTLLLTGWLASRLKWQRISAQRTGECWTSRWSSRSGDVVVRFSGRLSAAEEDPGISTIVLSTRAGITFRLVRDCGAAHITATVSGHGRELVHSVPQQSMDEATLLVRELSLSGKDASFQLALAEALELEKAFR